jgi:carbonic anhydrase/acetyltransferase-like protein (isoleucine patch superfamily)
MSSGEVVSAGAGGSPLRRYQDLVVGSRSWGRLLRFELAAWAARVPGAAGIVLRKRLFGGLLESCGHGTIWGHGVVLRHPGKMRIGPGVVVDDGVYFDAKGCDVGEFEIGEGAFVSRGCIVSGKDGALRLGPRVNLGAGCVLYASTRLEIGADTMLAANCYVGGGRYDPHAARDRPIAEQPLPREGVEIEEDCWLGAGVIVVDGVRIGRGSVVGAGAVVTKDLPPWTLAAGVPARPIGTRGERDSR